MNWLHDKRIDCYSLITGLSLEKYLSVVSEAHEQQGGIAGQRDVLKGVCGDCTVMGPLCF